MDGEDTINYFNTIQENNHIQGGGFRKIPTYGVKQEFIATPLKHPLARLLTRVRNVMNRYSGAGPSLTGNAPTENTRNGLKDAELPPPRKVAGGTGSLMGNLRFPYVQMLFFK